MPAHSSLCTCQASPRRFEQPDAPGKAQVTATLELVLSPWPVHLPRARGMPTGSGAQHPTQNTALANCASCSLASRAVAQPQSSQRACAKQTGAASTSRAQQHDAGAFRAAQPRASPRPSGCSTAASRWCVPLRLRPTGRRQSVCQICASHGAPYACGRVLPLCCAHRGAKQM